MPQKIIRTICYFAKEVTPEVIEKLDAVAQKLEHAGYLIQTKRICSPTLDMTALETAVNNPDYLLSVGSLSLERAVEQLPQFFSSRSINFNVDLTGAEIDNEHVDLLFRIISEKPSATFNFTYVFNNAKSSPYFPSADYEKDGFSIGLQPTDLSEGCTSLEQWLDAMKNCWAEIANIFSVDSDFLGIDTSVAPLSGSVAGSFVGFVKRLGLDFSQSTTTDFYTTITNFIKQHNPKYIGLSGMMLPCLEDDELAAEYDKGNFSIERNVFLSLHSGLGIDTYPIGVDERPERVIEILKLIQALSNKYQKPLSARFVSDGKSKIGEKSDFQNQYLTDCTIRPL
ncbi:MAG TPA: DUF711 family protein [Candidatus Saccharimonadales bacterium]|nr:DUF711 family protein [Candidatus Saccharimonadales bacterium]